MNCNTPKNDTLIAQGDQNGKDMQTGKVFVDNLSVVEQMKGAWTPRIYQSMEALIHHHEDGKAQTKIVITRLTTSGYGHASVV